MYAEDKRLAEAIRKGDEDAAAAFYQRYADKIYRMMYFASAGESDAQELTGAVFLSFYESLGRFQGRCKLTTWLYAIAKNTLKRYYHRKKKETAVSLDDATAAAEVGAYLDGLSRAADTPETLLARAEVVNVIRMALNDLKPIYREILTLRYVEGLSTAEVAACLHKTECNARVLLHRAAIALRRRLAGIAAETDLSLLTPR